MMPVQQGRIYSFGSLNWDTFNDLPGMLADSLPDTYGRALFDQWLSLANANNIKNASEIIDHVCEATAGWPELAKNCGVPQKMIDSIVPHHMLLSI